MARIVLDNITKKFGSVVAVDQVSLTVNDGEFFALLGPSGCGKTTTLRMIAGLELPNDGTISIGDREVTGLAPREPMWRWCFKTMRCTRTCRSSRTSAIP